MYKCFKKTSIYRIIGNPPPPPNFRRNTRKTDKVYDFLQSAKLTCVDYLCTRTPRSISQSPCATSVRHHSLTSFGIYPLNRRSGFKGHPRKLTLRIGGNRRLCPFFRVLRRKFGGGGGEIADNAMDGSPLDTLVPKWKKLVMN